MDVGTWISRNAERVRVDGRAVFRQGQVTGSWTVVDLSSRGLCARGALKDLSADEPVEVRVQVGRSSFIAQLRQRWSREIGDGEFAHGWEVLSVRDASRRKLDALVEPPPTRGIRSKRFGQLLGVA